MHILHDRQGDSGFTCFRVLSLSIEFYFHFEQIEKWSREKYAYLPFSPTFFWDICISWAAFWKVFQWNIMKNSFPFGGQIL